jgi:mannose-1-phosphate guanylyltransferase
MILKALFLAGGMGTRLRPLTNHVPKPMVPIMGIPLLERSIGELKQCGVDEIVLSTCYQANVIEQHFGPDSRNGIKIHCVCEEKPLGTGGAIKNCEKYFDETFFVFNSDILCNIDLKALAAFHKQKKADVTIASIEIDDPQNYGVIEYDPEDTILSFTEKPKPGEEKSHNINAGIYVFEPRVLDAIPAGKNVSIERDIFPMLLKEGYRMAVYRGNSYWIDIGTPRKYMQAHTDIFSGTCHVPENDFKSAQVYGRENVDLDPTAKITGPVWFGKNVHIGANAVIGPNVVIGDGFEAGRGLEVRNSVIWKNVMAGSGVSFDNSVVTSGCKVDSGVQCQNMIYSPESKLPFA